MPGIHVDSLFSSMLRCVYNYTIDIPAKAGNIPTNASVVIATIQKYSASVRTYNPLVINTDDKNVQSLFYNDRFQES